MEYNIRELKYSDYNNYLELINDFRETYFTEEDFINILDNLHNIKIYVIEKDSKLVASATLNIEQKFIHNCGKLAHVEDVCVKKEFRNSGYGKIIINKLIEEAKNMKCYKITLYCSENNSNFYKKYGFEITGHQMSQLLD